MKKNKHHWYSNEERNGYGLTACGRDGAKVGGLISFFFKMIKTKERCKICNKKYSEKEND